MPMEVSTTTSPVEGSSHWPRLDPSATSHRSLLKLPSPLRYQYRRSWSLVGSSRFGIVDFAHPRVEVVAFLPHTSRSHRSSHKRNRELVVLATDSFLIDGDLVSLLGNIEDTRVIQPKGITRDLRPFSTAESRSRFREDHPPFSRPVGKGC